MRALSLSIESSSVFHKGSLNQIVVYHGCSFHETWPTDVEPPNALAAADLHTFTPFLIPERKIIKDPITWMLLVNSKHFNVVVARHN